MKTSEFIKMLQKEDPNDECTVSVDNCPVSFVERLPYYYDGRLQCIERDASGKVIRVGWKAGGMKLKIHYDTIEDALMDYPDAEIEWSGLVRQGKSIDQGRIDYIDECVKNGKDFEDWLKRMHQNHSKGLPPPPIVITSEACPETLQFKMMKWFKKLGLVKSDVEE
jgi:hypothetical protein